MKASAIEYGYVIAGAGSAGCTLTARLAEDPSIRVCLVEAGGNGRSLFIRMPAGNGFIFGNPRLEAGTVYINNFFNAATQSPVGGFKQSGYGRENGFEGMRCFMQTRSVWLATNPSQPDPFAED